MHAYKRDMINNNKVNYIIYTDGFNEIDEIVFQEVSNRDNVRIISKRTVFSNRYIRMLFKAHFSFRLNSIVHLPMKKLWYRFLDQSFDNPCPILYVFNSSWYYPELFKYFKKKHPDCMMAFYFGDTIKSKKRVIKDLDVEYLKSNLDYVGSYNPDDVQEYGISYLPMCYSKVERFGSIAKNIKYDIVYIGASRNRFDTIESVYKKIRETDYSYFFYIVDSGNLEYESNDPNFIVSKMPMSYSEYMSYSLSARCLLEIVDKDSSGGTLRFWDAIMYDKCLITNNKEVLNSKFYDNKTIIFSESFENINYDNILSITEVNHKYDGENSPEVFLSRILRGISK